MEQSSSWEANSSSASQEILHSMCNLKVHNRIHMRRPPVPTLSQIHPVQDSPSSFLKIHFNVILTTTMAELSALRAAGHLKMSIDLTGNRTRNLPYWGVVSEPTAPPLAPVT
jgi:hypothetical protein